LKITEEYNLGKLYPNLVREWHPTKNSGLTPYQILPKSNKKVWWKCSQGHEWQVVIYHRTSGSGCPYCAGQRATKENNLVKRNPELAEEWHPTKNGKLKPEDLMPHSGKKVWWMCKKGHEWKASLDNRSRGTGCPYCAGKRKV
jgi:DNA-directed RNA polymerase subunit RPC12/RpoP